MANTTISTNNRLIDFRAKFFKEYVRTNRFSPYAGRGVNDVICVKSGKEPTIRHPLVSRLEGSGVSGSSSLRGNGEQLGNYSFDTNPTYYRHAVEFDKEELDKTNMALMQEASPLLRQWAMEQTRDRMLQALGATYDGTTYRNLEDADNTARDAYLTNNADRIIFGANIAHGNDFSAGLDGVDSSADTLTGARVSDMRELAENADPHIRPFQTDDGSEVFVLFAGPKGFRDLKDNLTTNYSNADIRGGGAMSKNGNILFRDGDLFWDGVIVRKVPEIAAIFTASGKALDGVGASSIDVEPAFLCGAQALLWSLGQAPMIKVDREYDYGFQPGVAVELKEDIKKPFYQNVQHGVVTGFFSGA